MSEECRVRFPLLAEESYDPNTFDYCQTNKNGMPTVKDWIEVFRSSIPGFKKTAAKDESVDADVREGKAEEFADRFAKICDSLDADPSSELPGFGRISINCATMCRLRDTCLRDAGFYDPYATLKADENAKALDLLPGVLAEVDAVTDPLERLHAAIRGVFAGNVFDLGAPKLVEKYEAGVSAGEMFRDARRDLLARPWAVDKLDAVSERFAEGKAPHARAVVFCDNAGSDVVLGMLPFMRELLRRGTDVVAAVNAVPSINDITVPEMRGIMERAAEIDGAVLADAWREGRWRLVSSGNDAPVIDLRGVSEAVAEEARGADLVVLEGMGRGIETNLYAKFTVESLKLAMIKHEEVATCLGGRLYDCVCQYFPPAEAAERGNGREVVHAAAAAV
eukprot:jgi/Ulvmu1/282/UM001_0286.1